MSDPRIERMLQETAREGSLPGWAVRDLNTAVDSSPFLADFMRRAVEGGELKHIRVANMTGQHGNFNADTGVMTLSSAIFWTRDADERIDLLTGVIGHETGHALMAESTRLSVVAYGQAVEDALRKGSIAGAETVDITQHAKAYVQAFRQNEGFAELASMNSVTSRIKNTHPHARDEDILLRLDRTSRCVTDGRLAQGIERDHNGMLSTGGVTNSPAVNAVAACHFDLRVGSLGESKQADYSTYYLTSAVSNAVGISEGVARSSRAPLPRIGLDMEELGSSFGAIQATGLRLGGPGEARVFTDTSHGQQRAVEVIQIGLGGATQPDVLPQMSRSGVQELADNPAHADHATYARIHDWVQGTGNWSADEARNVSASLYRQQAEDPMVKHVDQVTGAVGRDGAHNVFAVHSPFGEAGPHFHAHVDGRLAAQIPAQQSLEQAEVLRQIQSVQQTQERTQQQTEVQAQPMRGP